MLRLLLVSGILIFILFMSCQETLINQPETNPAAGYNSRDQEINKASLIYPVMKGEINLCRGVLDPVTGECKVNGKAVYTHNILNNSGGIIRIKVGLEMDAELCNKFMNPMRHSIYGNSTDTISINEGGKMLLEKSYGILYRPDLMLCVQYLIKTESIGIMQLNLLQRINY